MSSSTAAFCGGAFSWATAEFSRACRSAIQRSYLAWVLATSRSADDADRTFTSIEAVQIPIHSAATPTAAAAAICFCTVST